MDKYAWIVHLRCYTAVPESIIYYEIDPAGRRVLGPSWMVLQDRGVSGEILRLAQREQHLLAEAAKQGAATSEACAIYERRLGLAEEVIVEQRLKAAAFDAQGRELESTREKLAAAERRLQETEHQLAGARESVDDLVARWRFAREQTAAVERENRLKCVELAEKAGEIQRLAEEHDRLKVARDRLAVLADDRLAYINDFEGQAVSSGEENVQLRAHLAERTKEREGWKRTAEACSDRAAFLMTREKALLAAAEDAIGHIEKGRSWLLSHGLAVIYKDVVEQLDLAHEVLVQAPKGETVKEWTDPAAVHAAWIAEERAARAPKTSAPGVEAAALAFEDAVRIARGCLDYGGGYRGNGALLAAFYHGIETVISALAGAQERGLNDTQIAALHCMGTAHTGAPGNSSDTAPVRRSSGE